LSLQTNQLRSIGKNVLQYRTRKQILFPPKLKGIISAASVSNMQADQHLQYSCIRQGLKFATMTTNPVADS